MKKVLLTGAGGFVGSRIREHLRDRYDVTVCPRGMLGAVTQEQLHAFVQEAAPEVIIHTAAIADMGVCEKNPDASFRANVELTQWICQEARNVGAKALCFSSDQVYNACRPEDGPYREDMRLSPGNVYGRHKLEGEQRGLDVLPDALMLRATWMYDMPGYGLPVRGNLMMNLLTQAMHGRAQAYSATDFRGITYVRQVAQLVEAAFEAPGGAYNFGSDNPLSMVQLVRGAFRDMGLSEERIHELVQEDHSLPVRCLRMDQTKLRQNGLFFDETAEGIRRCLQDYRMG